MELVNVAQLVFNPARFRPARASRPRVVTGLVESRSCASRQAETQVHSMIFVIRERVTLLGSR